MNYSDFDYFMPTQILFGKGRFADLGTEASQFGQQALIVSYASERSLKLVESAKASLENAAVEMIGIGKVEPEPVPSTIDQIGHRFADSDVDVVVAIGGGSVLDAAKGIAVVLDEKGEAWDYVGREKVNEPVRPVVAIPTTAGTGSEVTPYAIFKHPEHHRKAGIVSPYIFPKIAILDPELTVSLPPRWTAISGLDAFGHALESYTSPIRNPMSSAISRKALGLIGRNLLQAYHNGKDLDARAAVLLGSTLAGIAIAHAGTGVAHALAATIGGFYPLEHGLLVGLILPEAIRYNIPVAKELYADVAQVVGLDVAGQPANQAAEQLARHVSGWIDEMGLTTPLRDLGVEQERIPAMIEDTSTQNSIDNNIRPLDEEDIEEFYERLV